MPSYCFFCLSVTVFPFSFLDTRKPKCFRASPLKLAGISAGFTDCVAGFSHTSFTFLMNLWTQTRLQRTMGMHGPRVSILPTFLCSSLLWGAGRWGNGRPYVWNNQTSKLTWGRFSHCETAKLVTLHPSRPLVIVFSLFTQWLKVIHLTQWAVFRMSEWLTKLMQAYEWFQSDQWHVGIIQTWRPSSVTESQNVCRDWNTVFLTA